MMFKTKAGHKNGIFCQWDVTFSHPNSKSPCCLSPLQEWCLTLVHHYTYALVILIQPHFLQFEYILIPAEPKSPKVIAFLVL
jgi:hypothetical protein